MSSEYNIDGCDIEVAPPVLNSMSGVFVYEDEFPPEGVVSKLNEHHFWVGGGVPHLLVAGVWTKISPDMK
jgi:hypothetical protein